MHRLFWLCSWFLVFGVATPVIAQSLVQAQPDGLIVCEAEDFAPSSGWKAKRWGENYYAATFANSFLSRKAFLGVDEQADGAVARIRVQVPRAGKYLALIRYEAAYRFETQFRLVVEQGGQRVLDRLYGANRNLKVWAFKQGLKSDLAWDWGASENIVWEGHDAFVELQSGEATLTLLAAKQPAPAAKRNVDLVMLTTDIEQVKMRLEKENYLPLDGMLTQSGDVWLRVTNRGDKPLNFKSGSAPAGGNWTEHSPYWVHLRQWKPVAVQVAPGQSSDWVEVGGLMDTLNDGSWAWNADGKYKAEFGVTAANGQREVIATFDGEAGDLRLAADADTRRSKRLRPVGDVLFELLDYLKEQPKFGQIPKRMPIFGSTFDPIPGDARHAAAVAEFKQLFALSGADGSKPTRGRGYIDVRSVPTPQLADYCQKLGEQAKEILVVSLGDEISLPSPPKNDVTHTAFREYLKSKGLRPADVDPAAGDDWNKLAYAPEPAVKSTNPGIFYWSQRFLYHSGIQGIKERTDILRKHLPNAGIGANYSPHYPTEHMFLGEVHKWSTVFRDDGMTLPWGEDYIWQVPVGSPQVNGINLDLFRAGLRGKPDRKIHYYVMPHAPNNTPRMWRRLFFSSLAHGMKQVNLFEFRPVQVAYTENHVSNPETYATVMRTFHELGTYEDLIQDGQVREANVGLWFSETGDIWSDTRGSFGAAKRLLYLALRNRNIPLDFILEPDAMDGTLARYKVLYLTDRHVSRAASEKIAAWVKAGGVLIGTAGAGMRDELDRPNTPLMSLFGVSNESLEVPLDKQIKFEKQDLPFAQPVAELSDNGKLYGIISRFATQGGNQKFKDGTPATTTHQVGQGFAHYAGYLPSLSYCHPALPQVPVDRGSSEDASVHFMPTQFDQDGLAAKFLFWPLTEKRITVPVVCEAGGERAHVETTIIDSPHGTVIPLIHWNRRPLQGLKVVVQVPVKGQNVSLASGGMVKVERDGDRLTIHCDLDAADAIVIR